MPELKIKQNISCFFLNDIESSLIQLPEEESKHAVKALRLNIGNQILLCNGKGKLALATIISNDYKKTIVEINDWIITEPLPYKLHIAISPLQHNDRLEWFIEKAVELGIEQITPLLCHRTEKKHINIERLNKISIAALKQSHQAYLPIVNQAQKIEDFIVQNKSENKGIALCEGNRIPINQWIEKSISNSFTVLIGPEGDFTENEFQQAIKNNFTPLNLGNSILRSETAAMFVAAAFRNQKM